jgi:hypothetical protein
MTVMAPCWLQTPYGQAVLEQLLVYCKGIKGKGSWHVRPCLQSWQSDASFENTRLS